MGQFAERFAIKQNKAVYGRKAQQVKNPPENITTADTFDDEQMDDMGSGEIDIKDIAVWKSTLCNQPGHVMPYRSIPE